MNAAMNDALALVGAVGRAQRIAFDVAPWPEPGIGWARRNLIQTLLIYAAMTRLRSALVPQYRDRARWACREWRRLRAMNETSARAAA